MINDAILLRRYAVDRDEDAFADFVQRHLSLVYSAAVRRLGGDTQRAEDIAQVVFCAVARDARQLSRHPNLTGWLYTATRYAVSDAIRAEKRRRAREKEAHTMNETLFVNESPTDWTRLRPVLDTTMDELSSADREAVLLRFFQGRPFAEIGAALGLSEDAARKRVDRALDKLGGLLGRRGIGSTSAALAALLASETISAAPATLAASVTGAAMATGGAAAGIFSLITVSKLQVGIAAVVIAGGAAGLITQQRRITELRASAVSVEQQRTALAAENVRLAQARAQAGAELATVRTDAETERGKLRSQIAALEKSAADANRRSAVRSPTAAPIAPLGDERNPPPPTTASPQEKEKLHRRYDPFLQKYGLTAAQADRFIDLKLAIFDAQADLQGAMRQAGAQGGTAGVEAMRSKLVKPMWDEIHQLLGEEGSKAYGKYEEISAYRFGFVEPMQPAFAAASAPLSPQQAEELTQALAASHRSVRATPTDLGTTGIIDWEAVVIRAGGFLTPAQLRVLQSYASRQKPALH